MVVQTRLNKYLCNCDLLEWTSDSGLTHIILALKPWWNHDSICWTAAAGEGQRLWLRHQRRHWKTPTNLQTTKSAKQSGYTACVARPIFLSEAFICCTNKHTNTAMRYFRDLKNHTTTCNSQQAQQPLCTGLKTKRRESAHAHLHYVAVPQRTVRVHCSLQDRKKDKCLTAKLQS